MLVAAPRWVAKVALLHLLFLVGRSERYAIRPHSQEASAGAAVAPRSGAVDRAARRGTKRWFSTAALLFGVAGAQAQDDTAAVFQQMDLNGDGKVDKEEYMKAATPPAELDEDTQKRLVKVYERIFALSDVTGDGALNEAEVGFAEQLALEAVRRKAVLYPAETWEEPEEGGARPYDLGEAATKDLFGQMDADSDGKIGRDEYVKAIHEAARQFGYASVDAPELGEWSEKLLKLADISGDGALDERELHFASLLVADSMESGLLYTKSVSGSVAQEVIASLDTDADGKIDKSELQAASKLVKQAEAEFAAVDADGDGSLDLDELSELVFRVLKSEL